MKDHTNTTVLFTGYAPVHFVCFKPLYEWLAAMPGIDVFVSGGLRSKVDDQTTYDLDALYGPLGVPENHRLSVEQIADLDVDFLFAANTKMITPRSVGKRVQIFHGVSFRNKAVREDNANADQYFIVGPYMRRAFANSGILPEDDPRALNIGFMKTDRLINGELDRMQTLQHHGLTGERPVLVYAPTGQKHNSLETMGEKVIKKLAATNAFDLIIKPHDHPKKPINWTQRLEPLTGPHTVVSRESDVVTLLQAADVLITDASSVSSEFSLADRPMVFLDVPKLIATADAAAGSQVDLNTWGRRCGTIAGDPDQALTAVEQALATPSAHSEIRQAMAADLFYNPGQATLAALGWLKSQMSAQTYYRNRRYHPMTNLM
ncbi:MAG: CDP-glycerol glycerophosphotransferase family protein [Phycisphaerales bacterium]